MRYLFGFFLPLAGVGLLAASTPAAQLLLPPVPHFETPFPAPPITPIKQPRYTEHQNPNDDAEEEHEQAKSTWKRMIAIFNRTIEDPVALFTFVLAVSTIGLWIVTWMAGRRQSRDTRFLIAQNRAVADQQFADISRSIAAAETSAEASMLQASAGRAWMVVEGLRLNEASTAHFQGKIYPKAILTQVRWINRGESPALRAVIHGEIIVQSATDMSIPRFSPSWEPQFWFGNAPIGPMAPVGGPLWPVVDQDYERVMSREGVIIVYGAVRYFDIFNPDNARITEVCFRAAFNGTITDPTSGRQMIHWDMFAAGEQNSAT